MKSPDLKRFRRTVQRWWKTERRDLPWRKTRDPYRILVSEIMLQQTQVDRVIPKYQAFIRRFPSFTKLARASRADVIRLWSGLGYNRRAVNLHRAAQHVMAIYGGRTAIDLTAIDLKKLMELPGVGAYTARAVLAFAYDAPSAPVDTNIRRIYIRHFGVSANERDLQAFADDMLPKHNTGEWSQMLMDFGALVCKAKNPTCALMRLRHIAEPEHTRRHQPFANSNRYWRGRIVAMLGTQRNAISKTVLLKKLPRGLPEKRARALIDALRHDGIVAQKDKRLVRLV